MANRPTREPPAETNAQRQPEETLLQLKPSMWRNRPFLFLLCVLLLCSPATALAVATRFGFDAHIPVMASLIPAVVGILVFMVWRLRCSSTELTVTTRRCILRRGVLSRFTTEVRHCDIRNIQIYQTFAQRIFGVGFICISSEAEDEHDIRVHGIPRPQFIAETIRKAQ